MSVEDFLKSGGLRFPLARNIFSLGNDSDLSAVKESFVEQFGAHESLDSLKLNVSKAK